MFFIPLFAEQWMVASTFCFLTDDVEEEDFFFFFKEFFLPHSQNWKTVRMECSGGEHRGLALPRSPACFAGAGSHPLVSWSV